MLLRDILKLWPIQKKWFCCFFFFRFVDMHFSHHFWRLSLFIHSDCERWPARCVWWMCSHVTIVVCVTRCRLPFPFIHIFLIICWLLKLVIHYYVGIQHDIRLEVPYCCTLSRTDVIDSQWERKIGWIRDCCHANCYYPLTTPGIA